MPQHTEELVQESGRGGRDGHSVKATLYPTRDHSSNEKYRGNTKTII